MIRGFFIFLVFICKRSVWEMTKRRHPKLVVVLCKPLFVLTAGESDSSPIGTGHNENSNRIESRQQIVILNDRFEVGTDSINCGQRMEGRVRETQV